MSKSKTNGTDVPKNIEPSENDPCMGESSNEEKTNFFIRFRDRMCKKWGLSHKVFYVGVGLVFLVAILFVIVIALGAAWPHIPHSQRYPVCRNPQCLHATSQILNAMNRSASPCTDLWTWSCGGWLTKNPLPKDRSIWNQKQQLVKQEAEKIRDLITTLNLPLHVASVEWKLKHLYEACLNVDNLNTDEARPLTYIISELGGWYILRDWDNADFDAKDLLRQLHVKYGVTPFFKITVEVDPYTPGQNIIRISPSGLGLPDREYYLKDQNDRIQTAYKELIRDIVRYMSSTRNEAEKFSNNMFNYEKRIAEISPSLQSLQDPIKTCNHITISELKETILNVPFYDILTSMFPEAHIDENTEVVVTSIEYLTEISQIISSTDRQTMNGYLMWTLVRRYLPYLSEKFTSALDNFHAELYDNDKLLMKIPVCKLSISRYSGTSKKVGSVFEFSAIIYGPYP